MQRFALVGAGFIGTEHARNLAAHPDVDLAVVYDVDAARAATLAARHGARPTTSVDEAFDPDVVDAVLIASSTDTHADNLRRAVDAGLAVLVEKPIDLALDAAVAAARYAVERGARVMVDFNRRFDRDHAELRRVVAEGGVGSLQLLQLSSRGPAVPPLSYIAVSGGQMRDQGVHFFDLARWLAGEDPVEVFAAGSALAEPRLREYGDVDTSAVTLRLAGGALVQVDCVRRIGYGYDERIEVLGATGLVESGRHRTGHVLRYSAGAVTQDGMDAGWFERARPTYAAALGHFVDALEGRGRSARRSSTASRRRRSPRRRRPRCAAAGPSRSSTPAWTSRRDPTLGLSS